jgi:hypothetical protein
MFGSLYENGNANAVHSTSSEQRNEQHKAHTCAPVTCLACPTYLRTARCSTAGLSPSGPLLLPRRSVTSSSHRSRGAACRRLPAVPVTFAQVARDSIQAHKVSALPLRVGAAVAFRERRCRAEAVLGRDARRKVVETPTGSTAVSAQAAGSPGPALGFDRFPQLCPRLTVRRAVKWVPSIV